MATIARTAADVRALLTFLTPAARDLVMARLGDQWRGAGIVSASLCAGDVCLWPAGLRDGIAVSHVPTGGVTFVDVAEGPEGTIEVREHTADADGRAQPVRVALYHSPVSARTEARRRANVHGCDYAGDVIDD